MNEEKNLPWKILIVDDDEDTHDVTEMALKRLVFEDRNLLILHAFTALEAKLKLIDHPDIVIALLDVVMENDTAGLDLVKVIREDMKKRRYPLDPEDRQSGQGAGGKRYTGIRHQ